MEVSIERGRVGKTGSATPPPPRRRRETSVKKAFSAFSFRAFTIESCEVLSRRRGTDRAVSEAAGDADRRRRASPQPPSASPVRALLSSRRPHQTRRRARAIDTSESKKTPRRCYYSIHNDASRFRAERGVARRAASHRTYPESPKMITFSRVRLRDAMVPGSSRCARGANEGMARALEENDDVLSPSWRKGPYPGGLRNSSLRGHRAFERSSRRRRVKKRRGYPIGDARASSVASPSDASRRSSIPLAE